MTTAFNILSAGKIEQMPQQLTLRKARLEDLPEMQRLFVETVTSVCCADYDTRQIKAWTSSIENTNRWRNIVEKQFVLLALHCDQIVGFTSLDNGTYIDLLYVHKNCQRQGIARTLYAAIEAEALRQKQPALTADVSLTARPFFERVGFTTLDEQTVVRNGIALTNFKMRKMLSGAT